MVATDSQYQKTTATELRERVHGVALTAAQTSVAPAKKPANWDESKAGKGYGGKFEEAKVKRDTDPGEEGQFDFKDSLGSKKKGGGGGKGKDPKKAAEAAAKKAAAETNRAANAAAARERKRSAERKAADARARRTKARKVEDIQADINDLNAEVKAQEAARGLAPGTDFPGKKDILRKQALLQVELLDAQLGDDAPILERIALRAKYLADIQKQGADPEVLDALQIDLDEFRAKSAEVEGDQTDRKTKKDEAEDKKAEAEKKRAETAQRVAKNKTESDKRRAETEKRRATSKAEQAQSNKTRAEREAQTTAMAEAKRKQMLAMRGIKASGSLNTDARREAAIRGHALSDGSYPIISAADWHKANAAMKRGAPSKKVEEHIKKRGKALGISC